MACERPKKIRNPRYKDMSLTDMYEYSERHFGIYRKPPDYYVEVGCGTCHSCQKRKLNGYKMRLMYECAKYPNSLFLTLSFTDDALKEYQSDYNVAVKQFLDAFRKRFGKGVKHFFVCEFGSLKGRPHYHGILFNVPRSCTEEDIESIWNRGNGIYRKTRGKFIGQYKKPRGIINASWLRDGNKSASYICKYLTKDYQNLEKQPRILISNGVGLDYLTKSQIAFHRDNLIPYMSYNGFKYPLPKFYKDKIFTQDLKDKLVVERMNEPYPQVKFLRGVEHYPAFPGYYPTYEKHLKGICFSNQALGLTKSYICKTKKRKIKDKNELLKKPNYEFK